MISAVRSVTFSCKDIDVVSVKSLKERFIITESDHLGLDRMLIKISPEHFHHGTVQYTYSSTVQRGRIKGNIYIIFMLNETIRLIAHRRIGITDYICALFPVSQTSQKIDVSVQKHLIQIAELSVHIFILPSCVFGKLLIILIGIAGLDFAIRSALLENFLLVVTDTNDVVRRGINRYRQQHHDYHHDADNSHYSLTGTS